MDNTSSLNPPSRIGILTLYRGNYNYGGQLQAYALYRVLADLNPHSDVRLISYNPPRDSGALLGRLRRIGLRYSAQIFMRKARYYMKLQFDRDFRSAISRRTELFRCFSESLPHTQDVNDESIRELELDLCVVGSDQVWTMQADKDVYFLNFSNKIKKVSYAASAGGLKAGKNDVDYLSQSLSSFSGVSVRESATQQLLASIPGIESQLVLDPTLLLSREKWVAEANKNAIGTCEPFVFVYILGEIIPYMKEIRDFAHDKGYAVVSIPHMQGKYRKEVERYSDHCLYDIGPREWLWLVHEAQAVCTDSYHGTAFSIIMGKPFAAIAKGGNGFNQRDDRLPTLLGMLNASDYLLSLTATSREIERAVEKSRHFSSSDIGKMKQASYSFLRDHCALD